MRNIAILYHQMLANFRELNVLLEQKKMPVALTQTAHCRYSLDCRVSWSSRKALPGRDSSCLIGFSYPLNNLYLLRSELLNNGFTALMCETLSMLRPTGL